MRLIGNREGSGREVRARPATDPGVFRVVTVGDLLDAFGRADGLARGAEVVDRIGRPVVSVEMVSGIAGVRQWVTFVAVDEGGGT